jgi:hypothetical protein
MERVAVLAVKQSAILPHHDDQFGPDRNDCSVTATSTVMSLPPVTTTPAAVTFTACRSTELSVQVPWLKTGSRAGLCG